MTSRMIAALAAALALTIPVNAQHSSASADQAQQILPSNFQPLPRPWLTGKVFDPSSGRWLPDDAGAGPAGDSILCEDFGTFVSAFGLRNIQMFGAGLRALATSLELEDETLYKLGYDIEIWGESLELDELLDIGGGHAVGRIILAGEATRHFELAGVDPYTAHVAASAVVAPAIDTWHTMGFTPEDVANTDIHRHMAYYLINGGTIENMGEIMHETFLQLMAVHLANNPDPARTDSSLPEINEDAVIYPLDDENIMVVEPTYGNITIIEITPP